MASGWQQIWDIGLILLVVAGAMVLVRPGSNGPSLVNTLGGAFSSITASAEGATQTPAAPKAANLTGPLKALSAMSPF